MQWCLVAVVGLLLAVSCAWGDDDCSPPSSGEKRTPPWECCKMGVSGTLTEDFLKDIEKCKEKFPLPGKLEEILKGPPSTAKKTVVTCAAECLFSERGMLTDDKTLDKDAVIKIFTRLFEGDKEWSSVIPKIFDKCFSSYSAEVDKSLECKSGAKEIEECIMREAFLVCPKKLWNDKANCETLKAKVTKCPKVHVMLFNPEN